MNKQCKNCMYWESKDLQTGNCHGSVPIAIVSNVKRKVLATEGSDCKTFQHGEYKENIMI